VLDQDKTPSVGICKNLPSMVTLLKKYLIQTHHVNAVLHHAIITCTLSTHANTHQVEGVASTFWQIQLRWVQSNGPHIPSQSKGEGRPVTGPSQSGMLPLALSSSHAALWLVVHTRCANLYPCCTVVHSSQAQMTSLLIKCSHLS